MMKKDKKMATEWKKPIEKVKSLYSEKELLTMSFKEYWALGLTPHIDKRTAMLGHSWGVK